MGLHCIRAMSHLPRGCECPGILPPAPARSLIAKFASILFLFNFIEISNLIFLVNLFTISLDFYYSFKRRAFLQDRIIKLQRFQSCLIILFYLDKEYEKNSRFIRFLS